MPVVSVRHLTAYRYRKPVAFGEHRVMYRPLESHDQRLLAAELTVSPDPSLLRHAHDVSGTTVAVTRFDTLADRLVFESRVRLDHLVLAPFDLEDESARVGAAGVTYHRDDAAELARAITRRHRDGGEAAAFAAQFVPVRGRARLSTVLAEMAQAIPAAFAYRLRLEGAPQTPAQTLETRTGSCRDFAVLMMEAARSLGIAARFVSGYVYSAGAGGRAGGGHTHAWTQAYIPGCGWTDFDPTNGIVGNAALIRVAAVIDPRLAIPLHGVWDGRRSDYLGMDVEVDVSVERNAGSQPRVDWRVAAGA